MKKKALYLMDDRRFDSVYGPEERAEIESLVEMVTDAQTEYTIKKNYHLLKDVEILFAGWGMPPLDEDFLLHAPRLKAVFYAAGSIRYFMTGAAWERNLVITSSSAVNAVPVAEYCLGTLLLSLKQAPFFSRRLAGGSPADFDKRSRVVAGIFGSTVGIVSLGMTGRRLLSLLKQFEVNIIVYSRSLTPEQAAAAGVESVSLRELFRRADAVTIHTALLPETRGMVSGELIASMKRNAVLLNTSRGGIIEEVKMIEVLRDRPDLTAILDVTDHEPPADGSPLFHLPNVFLTPHISGCIGVECRRMGRHAVAECRRYLNGEPLTSRIDRVTFREMA